MHISYGMSDHIVCLATAQTCPHKRQQSCFTRVLMTPAKGRKSHLKYEKMAGFHTYQSQGTGASCGAVDAETEARKAREARKVR